MTSFTDNSFPYVLICSTFATIVSLASVWIVTAAIICSALLPNSLLWQALSEDLRAMTRSPNMFSPRTSRRRRRAPCDIDAARRVANATAITPKEHASSLEMLQ